MPHILADGPDWLRANGTEGAPGTMVFTICGDVRREGVFELPLGTPLRYLVEELAGGTPEGRAVKAIFPGASNTVIVPEQLDTPLDFDSLRQVGSGLGAAGFAVFDDSACMVQAAYRYSRFLFVESCGQCPACKFGTGEVTETLSAIDAGGGSDRDFELILVRARGSTGGQKCALPTGESLLMQSLVQVFGDEFASHIGRSCPLPRELPFHKIVDWDASAGRFAYDLAYATVDWSPATTGCPVRSWWSATARAPGPRKEVASFQCSGHPPCLEESERFNRWMVDVVLAEPSRPRKPEHAGAGYEHLRRGVAGRIPRCQRSATLMRGSWAGRLPGRAP